GVSAQQDFIGNDFKLPAHPRILLKANEEARIKKTIANDRIWQNLQSAMVAECDKLVTTPTLERIQIGRRLLSVSREALRRIFLLSYAYRTTGNIAFLQRAEKEMLAVSA